MAGNDHRGDAPDVNPENDPPLSDDPRKWLLIWFLGQVFDWLREWHPVPPRLVPGTVMLRKDVIRTMQIDDGTFVLWRKSGLDTQQNLRTKQEVVLTDDLIAFIASKPILQKTDDKKPGRK